MNQNPLQQGGVMRCSHCGHDDCDDDEWAAFVIDDDAMEVLKLLERLYKLASGGGNLHCVVDDGNTDCIPDEIDDPRDGTTRSQLRIENALCKALGAMEYEKRNWLLDKFHNHEDEWKPKKRRKEA